MTERCDPFRFLERAEGLQRHAGARSRGRPVELFLRSSRRVTATADRFRPLSPFDSLQIGLEEGVAIRVREDRTGASGFSAAAGADEAAVGWAVERAVLALGWCGRQGQGPEWAGGDGKIRVDVCAAGRPSSSELGHWLATTMADLGREVSSGSLDAALVVECIVNDLGVRAVRMRQRFVARFRFEPRKAEGRKRYRTFVGTDLSILGRAIASAFEECPGESGQACPGGDGFPFLLLLPNAAASLVRALVEALHSDRRTVGLPVGRGWVVAEDPLAPDAPFGASFDDAGFESRAVELADGRTVTGAIEGPGLLRRPSFRDPPGPLALNLRVKADPVPLPPRSLPVLDLRVLPAEDGWLLEFTVGGRAEAPGERRRFAKSRPEELVLGVLGAVGEAQATWKGVVTPSLLLEGAGFTEA